MNNEPVAWMYRIKNSSNKWELIFNKPMSDDFFETIPLYTHPKELTDEEIADCKEQARKEFESMVTPQSIEIQLQILDRLFARAILRKVSEK